ncbi:hypothetical protein [Pseudomonas germanica]|uniref:Methyl-accepting chemotaxis protein n=1 Tax=Pseudomonas germanica TaxID=2815720 RepID=A0ABX8YQ67_9PSED|nr:hypothetical protein [Pseudomonas germanica]QYY82139.1 hypothetical protein J0G10_01400 [Pseudomonas germanica]
MKAIIQTIMLACVLQIFAGGVFTVYMLDRANVVSQSYTDNALRLQYNQLQVQFSDERNGMKEYVEKIVDLRINQKMSGIKQ